MNMLFLLNYLSDTAYYMIFAGFLGGTLSLPDPMYRQIFLLCVCAAACRLIAVRRPESVLRFLPMVGLPFLALLPGGLKAFVLVLPPILYLAYLLYKKQYLPSHSDLADSFVLLCKILPIPMIFTLLLGGTEIFTVFSFPYLIIFLAVRVFLLRILRHDETVLRKRGFRFVNALEVSLVLLLALALFSDTARSMLFGGVKFIYHGIVVPLLILVSYVFAAFGWLFLRLRALLRGEKPTELMEIKSAQENIKNLVKPEEGVPSEALFRILLALGIVLAAVLVFLLFRRLAANRGRRFASAGTETRELLDAPPPAAQRGVKRFAGSPPMKVRYWYRRYLLLARSRGAGLTEYQNSLEQLQETESRFIENKAALCRLRALYLPARYSERADHAAAAEAKKIYLSLRKKASD